MTKEIREYLEYLEGFFSAEHTESELLKLREELLRRIGFYSHERLIHLIVTMSFAVFFLLGLFMYFTTRQTGLLVLTVMFLVLLVPYIKHYYFLENSVQKLYKYYYKVERL